MLHIEREKNHYHNTVKYLVHAVSLESVKKIWLGISCQITTFLWPVDSNMLDWEYHVLNGLIEEQVTCPCPWDGVFCEGNQSSACDKSLAVCVSIDSTNLWSFI